MHCLKRLLIIKILFERKLFQKGLETTDKGVHLEYCIV